MNNAQNKAIMKLKFDIYDFLANVWEYAEANHGDYRIRYGAMKMAKDWSWSYRVWHNDPMTGTISEVAYDCGNECSKRNAKAEIMQALAQDMERLQAHA